MKTRIKLFKKVLQEYKEDIWYLLIAGIPASVAMPTFGKCFDYDSLY